MRSTNDFWIKINNFKSLFTKHKGWSVSTPLIYKILWGMKLPVKPPCYQRSASLILTNGLPFSILMTPVILLIAFLAGEDISLNTLAKVALYLFFSSSLFLVILRKYELKNKTVPLWDDL